MSKKSTKKLLKKLLSQYIKINERLSGLRIKLITWSDIAIWVMCIILAVNVVFYYYDKSRLGLEPIFALCIMLAGVFTSKYFAIWAFDMYAAKQQENLRHVMECYNSRYDTLTTTSGPIVFKMKAEEFFGGMITELVNIFVADGVEEQKAREFCLDLINNSNTEISEIIAVQKTIRPKILVNYAKEYKEAAEHCNQFGIADYINDVMRQQTDAGISDTTN